QILVLSIRPASDGAMFFYRARSSTFQGEGEVTLMAETHSEAVSDRLSFYRWRRRCGGRDGYFIFLRQFAVIERHRGHRGAINLIGLKLPATCDGKDFFFLEVWSCRRSLQLIN